MKILAVEQIRAADQSTIQHEPIASIDLMERASKVFVKWFVKKFSKKKPDDAVSKPKLVVVNRLLERCRQVVADEQSIEFLDLLDEEVMPQNSDVVLTLSQYVAALGQFRDAHHGYQLALSKDGWFVIES